ARRSRPGLGQVLAQLRPSLYGNAAYSGPFDFKPKGWTSVDGETAGTPGRHRPTAQRFWYLLRKRSAMNQTDARLKIYITAILRKDKALNEREVKAAIRKGLKLGRAPLGAGVIRQVRKSLGIDRPRAITYARNLLAKYPTLEAKKVIEDVGERFGISLAAPDVSHLRPA